MRHTEYAARPKGTDHEQTHASLQAATPRRGGTLRLGIADFAATDSLDPSLLETRMQQHLTWHLSFTLIQHVEMQENSPNILDSTRSFRTNRLGRFLYANMNHHIEHHLFPIVPFHKLPDLSADIADQLPEPDPGLIRTNREVLLAVINRSLGRPAKAATIRQAPHTITRHPRSAR